MVRRRSLQDTSGWKLVVELGDTFGTFDSPLIRLTSKHAKGTESSRRLVCKVSSCGDTAMACAMRASERKGPWGLEAAAEEQATTRWEREHAGSVPR